MKIKYDQVCDIIYLELPNQEHETHVIYSNYCYLVVTYLNSDLI